MRNETYDDSREAGGRPPVAGNGQAPRLGAGATVSIPPRSRPSAEFGSTAARARLALLRPQPVRLRPATTREN
jgi:hypothetical protein